ncbi:MAG: hypothetical protein KAT91_04035, partial [Candidatus Aenigmarchaeota archaeon]|nr:hypothetical protein [Candidatus Aenigmarchaeota archaeon]
EELNDVVKNVDTLLRELKDIENKTDIKLEKETARLGKMILNTQKENVKKTGVFEADICTLTNRVCDIETVQDKEYPTLQEVNELAEKLAVLETTAKNELLLEKDFDGYRKEFEDKISLLEKAILTKEVQTTQDNKTDAESIINLRIQEVSKNAFGKINQDLKPLVARINELTDDVDQMKELRSDMVDDLNKMLSTEKEKTDKPVKTHVSEILKTTGIEESVSNMKNEIDALKSNGVSQRLSVMEKHLEGIDHNGTMQKMVQLEKEISLMKSNGLVSKLVSLEKSQQDIRAEIEQELNNKMSSLEKENTLLRQEIEKIKEAYFQMVQIQQQTPLIIE